MHDTTAIDRDYKANILIIILTAAPDGTAVIIST